MIKKYYVLIGLSIFFIAFYYVDKNIFMKQRILQHSMWEADQYKDEIIGCYIDSRFVGFKKDTMIFDYKNGNYDTLILKYQYFGTMKVMDPKTKKTGKYSMKGTNWVHKMMDNMKCKKK